MEKLTWCLFRAFYTCSCLRKELTFYQRRNINTKRATKTLIDPFPNISTWSSSTDWWYCHGFILSLKLLLSSLPRVMDSLSTPPPPIRFTPCGCALDVCLLVTVTVCLLGEVGLMDDAFFFECNRDAVTHGCELPNLGAGN